MTKRQRAAVACTTLLGCFVAVCAWTGDWTPLVGTVIGVPLAAALIAVVVWVENGKDAE